MIIAFITGMAVGMALMIGAYYQERKENQERYDTMLKELDAAEDRIEELHRELIVKQNIIDSQCERINKQLRIINRRKNGERNI